MVQPADFLHGLVFQIQLASRPRESARPASTHNTAAALEMFPAVQSTDLAKRGVHYAFKRLGLALSSYSTFEVRRFDLATIVHDFSLRG